MRPFAERLERSAADAVTDLYDLALATLFFVTPWPLFRRFEAALGAVYGSVHFRVRQRQRARALARLDAFLDDQPPASRSRLSRAAFRRVWAGRDLSFLLGLARSRAIQDRELRRLRIDGLEHLRAAVGESRGVILWESWLGSRLLGEIALVRAGFALHQLHEPGHGGSRSWLGRRVVRRIYRNAERRVFAAVIEIDDRSLSYLRRVTRILDAGGIVCTNALGRRGDRFVEVDCLGDRCRVATGPLSLARMTGCALVPIFAYDDGGYRVVLEAPIRPRGAHSPGGPSPEQCAAHYARLLERHVRAAPQQWPMWHRRPAPD